MKEIELSKTGWKNKGKLAIVDEDIFDEVNRYSWSYSHGYAHNGKMNIRLHRFIWNLKVGEIPEELEIEHIDRNPLNCQISNLRLATHAENMRNKTKQKNNTSNFKGISKYVYRRENKNGTIYIKEKWRASITKDKRTYAKDFPFTEQGLQLAKEWYKQKSLELQGKFSIYNQDK